MSSIRAVVVDPSAPERLVIRDFDYPSASPSGALVRVKAVSLNRGEVRTAFNAEAGLRPGWDLAGIVEQQAADGSGPRTGSRVVGMLHSGAWAEVVAGPTTELSEAREFGPYDLILESVGGRSLANALAMLAPGGVCVNFGASGSSEVPSFDARRFFLTGGASLYGFIIFYELTRKSGAESLGRLARLIAEGRLRPQIDVEAPWTQIGDIAHQLLNRRIIGKAVLHIA